MTRSKNRAMSVVGTKRTTRVAALMSAFEALRLAHSHKAEAHMICVEEIPGHSALYHRILGKNHRPAGRTRPLRRASS